MKTNCGHCSKPLAGKMVVPGYHDKCVKEVVQLITTNKVLARQNGKATPGAMRLRLVATVNFRSSESTNFDEIMKKAKLALGRNEVIALKSQRGDQMVFIYAQDFIESRPGVKRAVLRSVRLRLRTGSSWNPLMLANYAERVGINLDGLKRFEEHYEEVAQKALKTVAKKLGVEKEVGKAA